MKVVGLPVVAVETVIRIADVVGMVMTVIVTLIIVGVIAIAEVVVMALTVVVAVMVLAVIAIAEVVIMALTVVVAVIVVAVIVRMADSTGKVTGFFPPCLRAILARVFFI